MLEDMISEIPIDVEIMKKKIIECRKDQLITYFYIRALVYNRTLDDWFNTVDNNQLYFWLNYLDKFIRSGIKNNIFSLDIKNNLYRILSTFRNRTNDSSILNQVNELISLLNQSSEKGYERKMVDEFTTRVLRTSPLKHLIKRIPPNWELLEEMVIVSFMNDFTFLLGLTREPESSFLEANIGSDLAPSSISNLLIKHSWILREQALTDRIIKLLNYNISSSKSEDSIFGNLQDNSKICLKKIKRFK